MKLIGIKRALLLGILLAINLALAGTFFFVIEPMRERARIQLLGIEGQIAGLQSKIQNVKRELADFERNLPRYEELKSVGFFNRQDRFDLERHLNEVREGAGLQGFNADMGQITEIQSRDAAASKSRLIYTRVNLKDLPVLADPDFYAFTDLLAEKFPAHVRVNSFHIARPRQVDADFLAQIRSKKKNSAIDIKFEFDWLTIVPGDTADNKAGNAWGRQR